MTVDNAVWLREEAGRTGRTRLVQCAYELETLHSKLERWEQVWTALNDMGAQLGDANKPLAVTASWALMQRENAELQSKLERCHEALKAVDSACDLPDRDYSAVERAALRQVREALSDE